MTAFDLQMNPAHPGFKLHQIERAKDKSFWSARVSRDIRLIVHKTATSFLLCYVDHHDAAYQWARTATSRTAIPSTGAQPNSSRSGKLSVRLRCHGLCGCRQAQRYSGVGDVLPRQWLPKHRYSQAHV